MLLPDAQHDKGIPALCKLLPHSSLCHRAEGIDPVQIDRAE